jgi:hypothetical protein
MLNETMVVVFSTLLKEWGEMEIKVLATWNMILEKTYSTNLKKLRALEAHIKLYQTLSNKLIKAIDQCFDDSSYLHLILLDRQYIQLTRFNNKLGQIQQDIEKTDQEVLDWYHADKNELRYQAEEEYEERNRVFEWL